MSRSSPVLTRLLPGRVGALACILLMAGCAAIAPATPDAPTSPTADAGVVNEVQGVPAASTAQAPPSTTRRDVNARLPPAAPSVAPPAATTAQTAPVASGRAVIPPAASTSKATATVEAAPKPAERAPKTPAPAAVAQPTAAPTLDLKSLEMRLKETKAVGVFAKLALKNQIDDLLDRFRAYYQGRLETSLAELRRSFDMLGLKAVALLQDADPPLARAIVSSRESLWGLLSDPVKFKTL
jgi:hypothetical protein